jgi:hypothetical protein
LVSTARERVLTTLPPAVSREEGFCPAARVERPQFVLTSRKPTATTISSTTQKIAVCENSAGPTMGMSASPGIASLSGRPRLVADFA